MFKPQCLTTSDSVLLPQAIPFPAMRFRPEIPANARNNSGRDFSGCLCYGLKGSLKTRGNSRFSVSGCIDCRPTQMQCFTPNHAANRQPENRKYRFQAAFWRAGGLIQQRVHKIFGVKRAQIVDAFAHADIAHGDGAAAGQRRQHAAFGGAVQLGYD